MQVVQEPIAFRYPFIYDEAEILELRNASSLKQLEGWNPQTAHQFLLKAATFEFH